MIAVFHDGEYHYDSTPFTPQHDSIACDEHDTYDSLIAKYKESHGEKYQQVKGIFILFDTTFKMLTTTEPATAWLPPDRAASQNTHQMRSCASGSVRVFGILPNSSVDISYVLPTNKPMIRELEAMADNISNTLKRSKRQHDHNEDL